MKVLPALIVIACVTKGVCQTPANLDHLYQSIVDEERNAEVARDRQREDQQLLIKAFDRDTKRFQEILNATTELACAQTPGICCAQDGGLSLYHKVLADWYGTKPKTGPSPCGFCESDP